MGGAILIGGYAVEICWACSWHGRRSQTRRAWLSGCLYVLTLQILGALSTMKPMLLQLPKEEPEAFDLT